MGPMHCVAEHFLFRLAAVKLDLMDCSSAALLEANATLTDGSSATIRLVLSMTLLRLMEGILQKMFDRRSLWAGLSE